MALLRLTEIHNSDMSSVHKISRFNLHVSEPLFQLSSTQIFFVTALLGAIILCSCSKVPIPFKVRQISFYFVRVRSPFSLTGLSAPALLNPFTSEGPFQGHPFIHLGILGRLFQF